MHKSKQPQARRLDSKKNQAECLPNNHTFHFGNKHHVKMPCRQFCYLLLLSTLRLDNKLLSSQRCTNHAPTNNNIEITPLNSNSSTHNNCYGDNNGPPVSSGVILKIWMETCLESFVWQGESHLTSPIVGPGLTSNQSIHVSTGLVNPLHNTLKVNIITHVSGVCRTCAETVHYVAEQERYHRFRHVTVCALNASVDVT